MKKWKKEKKRMEYAKKKKSFTSIEYFRWTVGGLQQLFSYDVNDALQLLQKLFNTLALHVHEGGKKVFYSLFGLIIFIIAHCTLFYTKSSMQHRIRVNGSRMRKKELELIPSEIGEALKGICTSLLFWLSQRTADKCRIKCS